MTNKKVYKRGQGKCLRYRTENRKFKNKLRKLFRRIKHYKNPLNFVNGLIKTNSTLGKKLEEKIGRLND